MKKNLFLWFLLFIFLSTYNYPEKREDTHGFFSIKEIEIKGIKNSSKEDLNLILEKMRKKNLIFLKKKDFENVIADISFINSLKIQKIYPDKIKITVIEDLPIGIYLSKKGQKYILLENNKFVEDKDFKFKNLPKVHGDGALEKFYDFYSNLKKTDLNLNLVQQFSYHDINRWDLLLKDEKLVKLPPENYQESVAKFLEIYEKSNFKKFKVFDFRIRNELIVK